jgi:DNA-binding transcriptional LysR family regulator
MNLLHLRYFYEVARARSFTESAKSLRVSQPAISKMVKALENDLGHVLFDRNRSGVTLTERGEILFDSASTIFAQTEAAEEKMRSLEEDSLSGEWGLGVSDNLALYLVPQVLGQFKKENPKLRIHLFSGTSSQIKTELQYDRCRLGIFFTPLRGSEPFESRMVYETEFWIVLARKNSWIKKSKPTVADLVSAKVPRIESRHRDYATGFPTHFHSAKLGLNTPPWLEVNQHEVKKRLVLEGIGFALLTRHTVEEEVRSGKLIRIDAGRKLGSPVYAVWKKDRGPGVASERFLAAFQRRH